MDSEGSHAMLSCHRAPCGWVTRRENIKEIVARERLRAAELNCDFKVRILILLIEKRPGDLVTYLDAPSPSKPAPLNTAMDVIIRSSPVASRRRHAVEKPRRSSSFSEQEKRNDLAKAIAAAAAAVGTPVPTVSWNSRPLRFDQYGAPGESTLENLEKLSIRIAAHAYCSPGGDLRRLFRVTSCSIWPDQALAVLARQPSTFANPSPSMPS
jgi:hypothetical protein